MSRVTHTEINKIRFNMIMHASHVNIVNTTCTNCVRRRGKIESRESRPWTVLDFQLNREMKISQYEIHYLVYLI